MPDTEPKGARRPPYLPPHGLPARLDDAAHARCLHMALAAVEAAQGDAARLPPVPTTPQ